MTAATRSKTLDRVLVLEMVRVTEAAAVAASTLTGRGDEKAADAAAVEAMRAALNELYMDGTVVIGEGERDEAPMLFIGEKVGSAIGKGPKIDIALDPLEGTTICATAGPNSACRARDRGGRRAAQRPRRLYGQDRGAARAIPRGSSTSTSRPARTSAPLAAAKGVEPSRTSSPACSIARAMQKLIAELRELGCGIMLIGDGDVAGVIATTNPDTTIDIYMGARAARPRAFSPRAALCVASAGSSRGGCCSATTTSAARAAKWGVTDLDKQYDLTELARGDCIFAATGVTDGSLLAGVKRKGGVMTTESVVMRASSGTVRWVKGEHRIGA